MLFNLLRDSRYESISSLVALIIIENVAILIGLAAIVGLLLSTDLDFPPL